MNPKHDASAVQDVVREYNDAWEKLAQARGKLFPPGTAVNVACGQYTGPGTVTNDSDCPIYKLPVRLENGNVWWYPLFACLPNAKVSPQPDEPKL